MAKSWRTLRVFISSTFKDMQAERDHLVRFVFPRLRENLLKNRIHVVDVDLRWGVTSELDVLSCCKEVIDACRPLFICILGGRYGWTPLGADNSITAAEINYAVLDRIGKHGHAFFYFRDPNITQSIEESTSGEYRELQGSDNEQKLKSLKLQIDESGLHPFVYPCRWDTQKQHLTNLEIFGERVYMDLIQSLEEFIEAPPKEIDKHYEETAMMNAFIEESAKRYFVGSRRPILSRLEAFCRAEGDPNILVVTGSSGIGKSALLAHFTRIHKGTSFKLISHFVGATLEPNNLHNLLFRLCSELNKADSVQDKVPDEVSELLAEFPNFLCRVAKSHHLVLILDSIDQLSPQDGAHSIFWLPHDLPPNVRIVLSSDEHIILNALRKRESSIVEISLDPLSEDDKRGIIGEFLQPIHKKLSPSQMGSLVSKRESNLPLYLLMALEDLRTMGIHEEINNHIDKLPDEVGALFVQVLERLEKDPGFIDNSNKTIGTELVRNFASFLGVSRKGLSQSELSDLIAPTDTKGNVAALIRFLRPYLMYKGEFLDFIHVRLREVVASKYLKDSEDKLNAHRELASFFHRTADPSRDSMWSGKVEHSFSELPHHQISSGNFCDVYATLSNFLFLKNKCSTDDGLRGLLHDYSEAIEKWPPMQLNEEKELLDSLSRLVRLHHKEWINDDTLLLQQLYPWLRWQFVASVNHSPQVNTAELIEHAVIQWGRKRQPWLRQVTYPTSTLKISQIPYHHVSRGFFTKDGNSIVTVGPKTFVWDCKTLMQHPSSLTKFGSHRVDVFSVVSGATTYDTPSALSAKGHLALATGVTQKTLKKDNICDVSIVKISSGKLIATWKASSTPLRGIGWSPDGSFLATVNVDGQACLWRPSETEPVASLLEPYSHGGSWTDIEHPMHGYDWPTSPIFSHDGRFLAIGRNDKCFIWDAKTRKLLACVEDPKPKATLRGSRWYGNRGIFCIAFSSDGSELAIGMWDGTIRLRNTENFEAGVLLEAPEPGVTHLVWSPTRRELAATYAYGDVYLWSTDPVIRRRRVVPCHSTATAVDFSPDGNSLLVTEENDRCYLCDVNEEIVSYWDTPSPAKEMDKVAFHPVLWDSQRRLIASGSVSGLCLVDGREGNKVGDASLDGEQATAMVYDPRLAILYIGTATGKLFLLNEQCQVIKKRDIPSVKTVHYLGLGANGVLVINDISSGVCLWDPLKDSFVSLFEKDSHPILTFLSKDNGLLACIRFCTRGKHSEAVYLYDFQRPLILNTPHREYTLNSQMKDRLFICGSFDAPRQGLWMGGGILEGRNCDYPFLTLLDLETGVYKDVITHKMEDIPSDGFTKSLALSPDGNFLAFQIASDPMVRILSIAKQKVVRKLSCKVHSGELPSIEWSPCGQFLAAGNPNGVSIWNTKGEFIAASVDKGIRSPLAWQANGRVLGFLDGDAEPCVMVLENG